MFVRVKRIKGTQYAYLVENEWTVKGSRQQVLQYLGKVHAVDKKADSELVLGNEFRKGLYDILFWELMRHGFERDRDLFTKGNLCIDVRGRVHDGRKPAVLQLNQGFLCDHTLQQLLNFRPLGTYQEIGRSLAFTLVEAGMQVPEEAFVSLVELAEHARSSQH